MYWDKELLKVFIQNGGCQFCGSQRCDGSIEWAQGCRDFRAFVNARMAARAKKIKEKNK